MKLNYETETEQKMISIVFLFSREEEQSRWFVNSKAYEHIMLLFSQRVDKGASFENINAHVRHYFFFVLFAFCKRL